MHKKLITTAISAAPKGMSQLATNSQERNKRRWATTTHTEGLGPVAGPGQAVIFAQDEINANQYQATSGDTFCAASSTTKSPRIITLCLRIDQGPVKGHLFSPPVRP